MSEPLYKRGHKIYLDEEQTIESQVNQYLGCRDGVVQMVEYRDESGYGRPTKLYFCQDTKHEVCAIIRQTYNLVYKTWNEEESMTFDTDSFEYFKALMGFNTDFKYAKIQLLRDY